MKFPLQHAENRFRYALAIASRGYGKYKRQIVALALLGFLSGIFEGIGINAIIPLMTFFIQEKTQEVDAISQFIKNAFQFFGVEFNIIFLIGFIIILFFLKSFITFISKYFSAKIQSSYEKNTRTELFRMALETHWPYLLRQKIGHLEKILFADIGTSSDLLVELGNAILLATSLVIYFVIALNINSGITLFTILFGCALFFLLKPYIYKTRVYSQKIQTTNKEVAHHINENMIGIKTIKSLSAEPSVSTRGEEYFERLRLAKNRISFYSNLTSTFIQPISLVFIALILTLYSSFSAFHFGSLLVIVYLVQKIFSYVQSIQTKLQNVNQLVPYLKSVIVLQEELQKNAEPSSGKEEFRFEHALKFQNISFSYGDGKKTLSNISFEIKKGEMVGLIGPSGAGKTTIVDLFLQLIRPNEGKILIDGKNISEILLKEWRKNISYVSQDIFLLNDTIENNIRFYDTSLTRDNILEAVKMANIYDFIYDQPLGFQTPVGERGMMLSLGQRQRIILARMLARKPKILILDEATSAIDNASELLIQKSIENLKGKITVLAIAHRLTTVMNSHRLIAIENGKIIEEGEPRALLSNKNSYFYKMYNIRKNYE